MTIDLERLKALALACGENWYVEQDIGNVLDLDDGPGEVFIIGANPKTVLALIEQLATATQHQDDLRSQFQRAEEQVRALRAERNQLIIERNQTLVRAIKAEHPPVTGPRTVSADELRKMMAAPRGPLMLVRNLPDACICPNCCIVLDPHANAIDPNDPLDDVLPLAADLPESEGGTCD